MAAVYSPRDDRRQANANSAPPENQSDVARDCNTGSVSGDNASIADATGVGQRLKPRGRALEAQERGAVAATDVAAPQIRVKEEQDEDGEYATAPAGHGHGQHAAGKPGSSDGDERTDGDWPFRCEDCSEAFVNKDEYLEHRREHTHDGPIVCLDTDSQWDDLLVSTDGGRRTLCCALCGRKFSSSRGFFTHQMKHRNQVIKKESMSDTGQNMVRQKVFECRDCGKTFASIGQCLNHQRSHKQASKSVFHQLAHLKKKSFQCPTCGRSYSRASALDAHQRCHEVKLVKSRGCETGKTSPVKMEEATDTTSPQLDGPQQKRFECTCGKAFRTLCGLGTHQRFSANCSNDKVKMAVKRSFECTECGKTFVSTVALSCHQRWHKRRAQLLCSGQTFKCKECGRVFTSLTFYNKHQRLAHSKELPAKSFLHQVFQLQKKAFECQDCGRRFSRASALQSHQLCHTDVFSDIIERCPKSSPLGSSLGSDQSDEDESENFVAGSAVYSQSTSQINSMEREESCDVADGAEDDEVVDDSLEVISVTASDSCSSDDDSLQDQNPDLELLCESDQEDKEDFCLNLSQEGEPVSSETINPEMNVKIVQIDYEHLKEGLENPEMDRSHPQDAKVFECPDCDRSFAKAMALRCHMLWHRGGMGKKSRFRKKIRNMAPIRKATITCEICGHESFTKTAHYFHLGKHEDRKPYKSVMYQLADLQKNSIKCEECGMQFSRLSALHSHQQHHNIAKKPYACLRCDKSYSNPSGLYNHRKVCGSKDPGSPNETVQKMEHFNPTKTLLGPKVHHCKKCGKGFWSLGAFFHHKQYQPQCADANMRITAASNESENGCVRRKRRGRKRGMVYSRHSRKTSAGTAHTETKEEHKCDVCGKSYRMLGCFLKHQLVHNTDQTPPPVKSFDHQVEQLKKNSYSCPDCGKLFSRAMALQFHMRSHGYETGLPGNLQLPQCRTCFAFFTCESALHLHQKECLGLENLSEGQLTEHQKKELENQSESPENNVLNQTTQSVNDPETTNQLKTLPSVDAGLKYKCDVCDRRFSVVGALNFHKRIHSTGHVSSKLKSEFRNPPKSTGKARAHSARAPFNCSECGRNFSTNSALGTHKRWHNDKKIARLLKNNKISKKSMDNGPFLCSLCGKGFFYLCVLRRHQKYHPPIKAQSGLQLKGETELGTTGEESNISCPDCDKSFSSGSLFASHFACKHTKPSDTVEEPKEMGASPLNVQPSGQPFKATLDPPKNNLTKAKGQRVKMKYQCPHCYRSFMNVRGLRAHKWQKHRRARGRPAAGSDGADKPFPCTQCEKRYSSQGALYNHKKVCSGHDVDLKRSLRPVKAPVAEGTSLPNRPLETTTKCLFKCQKCGKAFPSEEQLGAHKEAARTRPHCCALCCRGYWTESQLQQHLAWHDEVRRRLPTELRYRLSASVVSGPPSKLQTPAREAGDAVSLLKEPAAAADAQAPKNHKCPQCGKTFLSPRALDQHQAVHKSEEPYRCSLCPQSFREIRDLIDHHQECLGDRELRDTCLPAPTDTESFTCIECGISFSQETDLHQHYIEHARGVF
ncbi:uncharacterized protein LOC143473271 isoform X2 [Brachyhypopomus gauderio]|uniref:uncharacterized protein LOC143473271 isoform X2 n=1 Tax=Brachyhypopomus gauderio TaxID=698409 RepID=UPI0040435482